MAVIVRQVLVSDALFPAAAGLFDAYRQHYGANPAPEATPAWLRTQLNADRLRIFVAVEDHDVRAILTVTVVPASLTLRTAWLIRDVFVAPAARRGGLATALLAHVVGAAGADGAHRVSLQTEEGNAGALALYAGQGFERVTDLHLLNRTL